MRGVCVYNTTLYMYMGVHVRVMDVMGDNEVRNNTLTL